MGSNVFPLPTILFQFLFLLVAIAIESFILHKNLNLGRQTSADYAMLINLLSSIVGWWIFFYVLPLLPVELRAQVISYIFFDTFFTINQSSTYTTQLILTIFIVFLSNYLLKLNFLQLIQFLIEPPKPTTSEPQERKLKTIADRNVKIQESPNLANIMFQATFCSYGVILVIIFLIRSEII
ncbi:MULTISPECIES: filament integrity protein FraC [Cyanophyceae]|uniref:filament integrity protein FraC n=1 Tax=Cyanophyceae TaxID=3028117 RepID=UPI0016848338|nr:filament integrity protein FraC [Trichocoleus sp. FACHB-69]MBD1931834.1 hypothetical protein [Trichocoleus sp. FACHB-69]